MKRFIVLLLSLVIVGLAISGTNAAYRQQVELEADYLVAASPSPAPTSTPTPAPTNTPTPSPTPKPATWSGEFEIIISYQDNTAYRVDDPRSLYGNYRVEIFNNTGKDGLPPVQINNWDISFGVNATFDQSFFNLKQESLGNNQYKLSALSHSNVINPGGKRDNMGGVIRTYPLASYVDGVLKRTNNPELAKLMFQNVTFSISDIRNGQTVAVHPSRVNFRYEPPVLQGWHAEWDLGLK